MWFRDMIIEQRWLVGVGGCELRDVSIWSGSELDAEVGRGGVWRERMRRGDLQMSMAV